MRAGLGCALLLCQAGSATVALSAAACVSSAARMLTSLLLSVVSRLFCLHSMTLERYEVVPPNIQQDIVAKNKVAA